MGISTQSIHTCRDIPFNKFKKKRIIFQSKKMILRIVKMRCIVYINYKILILKQENRLLTCSLAKTPCCISSAEIKMTNVINAIDRLIRMELMLLPVNIHLKHFDVEIK